MYLINHYKRWDAFCLMADTRSVILFLYFNLFIIGFLLLFLLHSLTFIYSLVTRWQVHVFHSHHLLGLLYLGVLFSCALGVGVQLDLVVPHNAWAWAEDLIHSPHHNAYCVLLLGLDLAQEAPLHPW